MYKSAQNTNQASEQQPGPDQSQANAGNTGKPGNEEVTDVDFEEVK
jgi:hypothetical protein